MALIKGVTFALFILVCLSLHHEVNSRKVHTREPLTPMKEAILKVEQRRAAKAKLIETILNEEEKDLDDEETEVKKKEETIITQKHNENHRKRYGDELLNEIINEDEELPNFALRRPPNEFCSYTSLQVISPTSGSIWKIGSSQSILWDYNWKQLLSSQHLRIELFVSAPPGSNMDRRVGILATRVPAYLRNFTWNVDSSLSANENLKYYIHLSTVEEPNYCADGAQFEMRRICKGSSVSSSCTEQSNPNYFKEDPLQVISPVHGTPYLVKRDTDNNNNNSNDNTQQQQQVIEEGINYEDIEKVKKQKEKEEWKKKLKKERHEQTHRTSLRGKKEIVHLEKKHK